MALGRMRAHVGIDVLREVVHVRRRRGQRDAVRRAREFARLCAVVHSVERDDLERALDLLEAHPRLDTTDALHAATALNRGITTMLSVDRSFDQLEGLLRVDPADAPGIAALLEQPTDAL